MPVDDAAARQVIGGKFDDDSVGRKDPDVVLPHLATNRGKHLVTVCQLNAEHRMGRASTTVSSSSSAPSFFAIDSNLLRVRLTDRPKLASR